MKEIEPVNFQKFEDQGKEAIGRRSKDFHLGKANLQVRLASDMDDGFLERLGRILKSETFPLKNLKP
jgi:hypothetical protein